MYFAIATITPLKCLGFFSNKNMNCIGKFIDPYHRGTITLAGYNA